MNVPFEREVVVHFLQPAPRRYARVDLFWKTAFGAIIFEVDEWAHSSGYSVQYECMRMQLVHDALRAKVDKLHFIRYNPHPIRNAPKPTLEEREMAIRNAIEFEPLESSLTITYLFYHPGSDGWPGIVLSPEYTLKNYVRLQSIRRDATSI